MRVLPSLVVVSVFFFGCHGDEKLRSVEEVPEPEPVPVAERGAPACVSSGELCNGLDDDCDGAVDEDMLLSTCGVGACQNVSATCTDGAPVTCEPLPASTEACDGIDNDCDGTVDEDLLANISTDKRITHNPASSDYVYAAWTGSRFALVWQDRRDGAGQGGEIYFAPLDARAERLGPDVRVTQSPELNAHPAVAWSGSHFGLVYSQGKGADSDIWFRALQEDGTPRAEPTRVSNSVSSSDWPDVVWTGTGFGVAWVDGRSGKTDIWFRLLDADGRPATGERRITMDPEHQQTPILKWNGTEFGLVWSDARHGKRQVYFQRLAASGEPIGQPTRVSQSESEASWPDLAWNGNGWALVWQDERDGNPEIYFARLDAEGKAQGGEVRITETGLDSGYPSIDWNGFQYGLSWQEERAETSTLYFAAVNAQGVKNGGDLRISSGNRNSSFTTALWNGSTYAFSWRDDRDGNTELYFAYVGCP